MNTFFPMMSATRKYFKEHGQKVSYDKGQTFVRPEDESPWVFFLESGIAEISYGFSDGSNRLLGYFFPRAVFAQNGSFFSNLGSGLEYSAMEKVDLYRLPRDEFFQMLQNNQVLNMEYTKLLLCNQFLLIERVAYMGESTIERKVVRLLIGLSLYYGHQDGDVYKVDIPVTQETIARFTHATRESVSKTIRQLVKDGVLIFSKKRLTITSLQALSDMLEA